MENDERYYKFSIKYMVGDADGKAKEKVDISGDNPFVWLIAEALNKLKPKPDHWGIVLEESDYKSNLDRGIISKQEYNLLCLVTGGFEDDALENFCKENELSNISLVEDQLAEFGDAFRTETERSFLIFTNCKVKIVE